ncbi:DUF4247 domain-containing protein [Metallumcola ferriviriculae]|uniref:DUF4247 domain-containing protein n=1 Tax=Metallumcola ferriviriculae TaxID=3039180 RepID=A0AAU0UI88_9FIRM|nr:DUF4247 domain-containing protein [Desulfitibacteraceae bacterium MK1]
MKRWLALLFAVTTFLVVGCTAATVESYLDKNYSLVDVQQSRYGTNDAARVYQIPDSVDNAAKFIAGKYPPKSMTPPGTAEDRRVLVYPKLVVDIYSQDGQTMAEVASRQYIRDHYSSGGFFRGYLTAAVIGNIFNGPRSVRDGGFSPYTGRSSVPSYGKTVREGSVGSRTVRGGGIFGGK